MSREVWMQVLHVGRVRAVVLSVGRVAERACDVHGRDRGRLGVRG